MDNDSDGDTDCADSDCASEPVCSGSGQTCSEVMTCAQACGNDVTCINACRAAGCQTAQDGFDDVLGCMLGTCFGDCGTDPTSQACQTCLALNCVMEISACISDQCQTGGETNCGDGVDNDSDGDTDCADSDCAADPLCSSTTEIDCADGVDNDNDGDTDCADSDCSGHPSCSGTGWDCVDILTCSANCGSDMVCVQNCRAGGCPSAQQAFDDTYTCMVSSCLSDCLADPQSAACLGCMNTSCSTELTACTTHSCPP